MLKAQQLQRAALAAAEAEAPDLALRFWVSLGQNRSKKGSPRATNPPSRFCVLLFLGRIQSGEPSKSRVCLSLVFLGLSFTLLSGKGSKNLQSPPGSVFALRLNATQKHQKETGRLAFGFRTRGVQTKTNTSTQKPKT